MTAKKRARRKYTEDYKLSEAARVSGEPDTALGAGVRGGSFQVGRLTGDEVQYGFIRTHAGCCRWCMKELFRVSRDGLGSRRMASVVISIYVNGEL